MLSLATLEKIWNSLKKFPWPTITFFVALLSAYLLTVYVSEVHDHVYDVKEGRNMVIEQIIQRMREKDALQQQTIQAGNRLVDELTRQRNEEKKPQ